ncbi:hypothetical protein JS520_00645 [Candidatus Vidania fulgoroideae]|nr:hypothetical protein JS520_00645 [Candidatus Vidania fulgoroideae]
MLFTNQVDLFISEIRRILAFTSGYYLDCTFGLGIISKHIYSFVTLNGKLFIYERNPIYFNNIGSFCSINVFSFNFSNLRIFDLKLEVGFSFAIVDIGYCDSEILNKRSVLNFLSYSGTVSVIEALNFFSSSYLATILGSFGNSVIRFKLMSLLRTWRAQPVIYNMSFMVACGRNYCYFRKFLDIISRYTSIEIISLNTLLLNLFILIGVGAYIIFICFNSQEVWVVDCFVKRYLSKISYFRTFSVSFGDNSTMAFMKVLKKKCL